MSFQHRRRSSQIKAQEEATFIKYYQREYSPLQFLSYKHRRCISDRQKGRRRSFRCSLLDITKLIPKSIPCGRPQFCNVVESTSELGLAGKRHFFSSDSKTNKSLDAVLCTMVLLSNLAEPQWVTIACEDTVLDQVICTNKTNRTTLSSQVEQNTGFLSCKKSHIFYTKCYLFQRFQVLSKFQLNNIHSECCGFDAKEIKTLLEIVFNAVGLSVLPVICCHSQQKQNFHLYLFQQYWISFSVTKQILNRSESEDKFVVSETRALKQSQHERHFSNIVFLCLKNNHYFSIHLVCKKKANCQNSKDEAACQCRADSPEFCKEIQKNFTKCFPLFYLSRNGTCEHFVHNTQIAPTENRNRTLGSVSSSSLGSGQRSQMQNMIDASETLQDLSCMSLTPGPSEEYSFGQICTYTLDKFGNLLPCKSGFHLEECKDYQCNAQFKCPQYYCIPFAYLCDMKWDCPEGVDESIEQHCAPTRKCSNMFKCVNSQICTHLLDVCDSTADCPFQDDEMFCDLAGILCPTGCYCFVYAVMCTNIPVDASLFSKMPHISIHSTNTTISGLALKKWQGSLLVLNVSRNTISNVCFKQSQLNNLALFDISSNVVEFLASGCISSLRALHTVHFAQNTLQKLSEKSFENLTSLFSVDLSHNNLKTLLKYSFCTVTKLQILFLQGNSLTQIDSEAFYFLQSRALVTSNHKICCLLDKEDHLCIAEVPWYDTCKTKMPYASFIGSVTLSVLVLLVNGPLLAYHSVTETGSSKNIISLGIAGDFLVGWYLAIVSGACVYIPHNLLVNEDIWKKSIFCTCAFLFVLLSKLISLVSTDLLSFARLMVVLYPFDSKFKQSEYVNRTAFIAIVVTLKIALTFVIFFKIHNPKIPTVLCHPSIDPTNTMLSPRVVTLLFWLSELVSIAFVSVLYLHMFSEMKKSQESAQRSGSDKSSRVGMVVQVVIHVAVRMCCWVPSSSTYVVALFLPKYPVHMPVWNTVFVAPLVPIVNAFQFINTQRSKT